MDASQPLVSIGTPLYNEEEHLREALDALLRQDYPNFELIISDNGSTDSTPVICREYAARDQRIRYHRNEANHGTAWNFNQAFRLSRGEYFMWAAGHDSWSPKMVSTCVGELGREPAAVLCYPRTCLIDSGGHEIEQVASYVDTRGVGVVQRFNLALWVQINPGAVYGLMRARALRKTRMLRAVYGSDHMLLGELSLLGSFVHVPETLFYLREKTGEGRCMTERAKIRRQLAMLHPEGVGMRMHYCYLHYACHTICGVMRAELGLATKLVLIGSAVLRYFLRWYKYLPGRVRHPIRDHFRAASGIIETDR